MPVWMSAGADGLHVSKSQQWAMAVFFPSEFDHLSTDEIITFYFVAGYKYSMISKFLDEFHAVNISKRTLMRRLQALGLRRRNNTVCLDNLRACIRQELSEHA